MSAFEILVPATRGARRGWTLIHCVWPGVLAAALPGFLVPPLRSASLLQRVRCLPAPSTALPRRFWLARLFALMAVISGLFFPRSGLPQAATTIDPQPVPPATMINSMLASDDDVEDLRAKYAANRAVLFDYPVSRVTVNAFIQAVQANAQSFSASGAYDGPSAHIAALAEEFISRLGPQQSFATPDFVQMATAPRVGLQRIAFLALTRTGEIPEKFTPLLMQLLNQYYWAEGALIALGPKAKAAVPELLWMLESGKLSEVVAAARVLAAIGRRAADPALPVMTRLAGNAVPEISYRLFENLLKLDPTSKIAREGLEKLATAAKALPFGDQLYAHSLLLKAGHDVPFHLRTLRNALKEPDAETRSIAARLLIEVTDDRQARKEAADEAIRLVERGASDAGTRAADGLRQLGPADREIAPRLIEAIQKLVAEMNKGGPSVGYTSSMLASTVTGLGGLGPAAQSGVPLLKSLAQFTSPKPIPEMDFRIRDAAALALRSIQRDQTRRPELGHSGFYAMATNSRRGSGVRCQAWKCTRFFPEPQCQNNGEH
jgi:hypothetical protein